MLGGFLRVCSRNKYCAWTVLYVGDDFHELFALIKHFDDPNYCGVFEGANFHRRINLGGL